MRPLFDTYYPHKHWNSTPATPIWKKFEKQKNRKCGRNRYRKIECGKIMAKTRKKSKFKHALIGGKRYYFYKIVWKDPCGDSGHADASEVKDLKPATMISQAYVFDKDSKHVWTFASYDSEQAVFSDRNVFPKCIISKMEKIKI